MKNKLQGDILEVGSAQIKEGKLRIYIERKGVMFYVFGILGNDGFPKFPRDNGESNMLLFYKIKKKIHISGMKVDDRLRGSGVIDILFYTSLRISELLDISGLETGMIKNQVFLGR